MKLEAILLVFAISCLGAKTEAAHSEQPKRKYTWCCKSRQEVAKCLHWNHEGWLDFKCIQAPHHNDKDPTAVCVDKIKQGHGEAGGADVMVLDAGDIYQHRDENIRVIAAEDVGVPNEASYYAVAVVKKRNKMNGQGEKLTLRNTPRFKTCHTGVGKTSGWNIPMGWFETQGIDASGIPASCAPGAFIEKYQKLLPRGVFKNKWCSLCIGSPPGQTSATSSGLYEDNICERGNNERYYGYRGAFDCMNAGAGDIAFIKHSTVLDLHTNRVINKNDYELLCTDDKRAHPDDYANCNIEKVPSHAVVVSGDMSAEDVNAIRSKLPSRGLLFGGTPRPADRVYGGKNLLWGSSVRAFVDVKPEKKLPRDYLGGYYCKILAMYKDRRATDSSCAQ